MADLSEPLHVEVVWATSEQQRLIQVELPPGGTAADAIRLSGLLDQCPEIDLAHSPIGIFGRLAELSTKLAPGDRVEIYRALLADPKEARRARVQAARARCKSRSNSSATTGS